jgi:hypothetical protein
MDKGELKCPECGKSFPGENLLKWHRDAVHRQEIRSNQEIKPFGETHLQTSKVKIKNITIVK